MTTRKLYSKEFLITHKLQPFLTAGKASVVSGLPLSENVGSWR
jgi:hypothetical protein